MTELLFIGNAGWSLSRQHQEVLPPVGGSHLARYAGTFGCVEINSSFYRPHRPATWAKWAESTPEHFRFSVKIPKAISHERRLRDSEESMRTFLRETDNLGIKRRVLLLQLPPSLPLESGVAEEFLEMVRRHYSGPLAIEPRHRSWFSEEAEALMQKYRLARVGADPVPAGGSSAPGMSGDVVYFRMHGSPRTYWSAYDDVQLEQLARDIVSVLNAGRECWCIFDNTAAGHALMDALKLREILRES